MLTLAMLFWIGRALSAPAAYWWCWGILTAISAIKFCATIYNLGKDNNKEGK